jgi:hypothetical protein
MALRAGGFALALKTLPVLFDELCDVTTLAEMTRTAELAHDRRARVRSALYDPPEMPALTDGAL